MKSFPNSNLAVDGGRGKSRVVLVKVGEIKLVNGARETWLSIPNVSVACSRQTMTMHRSGDENNPTPASEDVF